MVTLLSLGTVHTDCNGAALRSPAQFLAVSGLFDKQLTRAGSPLAKNTWQLVGLLSTGGPKFPPGPSCFLWERNSRKALSQKGPRSSSWCALVASCAVFTLPRRCEHCGRGHRSHGLEGGKACGSPGHRGRNHTKAVMENNPPP